MDLVSYRYLVWYMLAVPVQYGMSKRELLSPSPLELPGTWYLVATVLIWLWRSGGVGITSKIVL